MTALDWTHATRDVPEGGLAISRRATAEETDALAAAIEVPSVQSLAATYRLAPVAGGRFTLKGQIEATVTQACVVTLDPVTSQVSLPLNVIFTSRAQGPHGDSEGSLDDLEQPDEEPIEHGVIDVGRVVVEELLSNLDPYPRSADAQLERTEAGGEGGPQHPFAALARLKKSGDSE